MGWLLLATQGLPASSSPPIAVTPHPTCDLCLVAAAVLVALRQQHVRRLDVAMHDAIVVKELQTPVRLNPAAASTSVSISLPTQFGHLQPEKAAFHTTSCSSGHHGVAC